MKIDKEFKIAILDMPTAEKDKILVRLIRKDKKLINRLYFELIDTSTVEERRAILGENISDSFKDKSYSFKPLSLKWEMSFRSTDIQEHLFSTKDKYGEIVLTLLLLNEAIGNNSERMKALSRGRVYKLNIYIINKVYKVLGLISKMHEDIHLDFKEDLCNLSNKIGPIDSLMQECIYNGLDMNWLCGSSIPEDIIQTTKDLRKQGFLR